MSTVLIIDDGIELAKETRSLLTDNGIEDVEIWHVNNSGDEKKKIISRGVTYYRMGMENAISEIRDTDAKVLITDLVLAEGEDDPINVLARDKILEFYPLEYEMHTIGEVIHRFCKDTQIKTRIGGVLLLDRFLSEKKCDREVIVKSDYKVSAVDEYFELHKKAYFPCSRHVTHELVRNVIKLLDESIEGKLWGNGTELWFEADDTITHDPPREKYLFEAAKNKIRKYLEELCNCSLPNSWFSDEEFGHLYQDLKHLIGYHSVFEGTIEEVRSLTVGNMLILLASVVGNKTNDGRNWLESIKWSSINARKVILPKQNREQAMNAVRCLVSEDGLYKKLVMHRTDPILFVRKVMLDRGILTVELSYDLTDLIDILKKDGESGGKATKAYQGFIKAASETERGIEPMCAIRLFVENIGDEKCTVLEIRPSR